MKFANLILQSREKSSSICQPNRNHTKDYYTLLDQENLRVKKSRTNSCKEKN
jgi:hypothetical protein